MFHSLIYILMKLILKTMKFPIYIILFFIISINPLKALDVKSYISDSNRNDSIFKKPFINDKILGPGDVIDIEVLDLPEFSAKVIVDPMGKIYLPRIRGWTVEGLTYSELQNKLTTKLKEFIKDPIVFIRPVAYRNIRIFVGGEVSRPGFYFLQGTQSFKSGDTSEGGLFPSIFDAIKMASGITDESDLRKVTVVRKLANEDKAHTSVNLLTSLDEVNSDSNLRLFDGDVVIVSKKNNNNLDQLYKANLTNLNPAFLSVNVIGRVREPGVYEIPRGASLLQALELANGTKFFHGKIKFIRFKSNGELDTRVFSIKKLIPIGSYENPVLRSGDIIRVKNSVISLGFEFVNEITKPISNLATPVLLYQAF